MTHARRSHGLAFRRRSLLESPNILLLRRRGGSGCSRAQGIAALPKGGTAPHRSAAHEARRLLRESLIADPTAAQFCPSQARLARHDRGKANWDVLSTCAQPFVHRRLTLAGRGGGCWAGDIRCWSKREVRRSPNKEGGGSLRSSAARHPSSEDPRVPPQTAGR